MKQYISPLYLRDIPTKIRKRHRQHIGESSHPFPELTKRQQEIVTALCEDYAPRKEFAFKLGMTDAYMKIFLSNVYRALNDGSGGPWCERQVVIEYWRRKFIARFKRPVCMEDFYSPIKQ